MVLWMALAKLGAVAVPINTAYRGPLLEHVFKTCQATACIVEDRLAGVTGAASEGFARFNQVFIRGDDLAERPATARRFDSLQTANAGDNLDIAQGHEDTTCIIFTSGTTGPSKGVMLSHRYLIAYGPM